MTATRRCRRLLVAVAILVLLVWALPAGTASRLAPPEAVDPGLAGPLWLRTPEIAPTGSPLGLLVGGARAGATVLLMASGSIGLDVLRGVATTDGSVSLVLPSGITDAAGIVVLEATSEGRTVSGTLWLAPGPVVAPVVLAVGARSVVANGADRAMAVALPVDALGNAVAEGTAVDVVRLTPDGQMLRYQTTTASLLAWTDLRAGVHSGRNDVRAGVGDTTGGVSTLDEVAAVPVPFSLIPAGPMPPADGNSLVEVRTVALRDLYGNVQPDGTLVFLEWDGPAGRSRASSVTVDGVAHFFLEAPTTPGPLTLRAFCRGTWTTTSQRIDVAPVAGRLPVSARRVEEGIEVTIGPLTGPTGGFVPDGGVAVVTATDSLSHEIHDSAQLVNGKAKLVIPATTLSGTVTIGVNALGIVGSVVVS